MTYLLGLSLRMGRPFREMMAGMRSSDVAWYQAYDLSQAPREERLLDKFRKRLPKGVVVRKTDGN